MDQVAAAARTDRTDHLTSLSVALLARYHRTADAVDLDRAVTVARQAAGLAEAGEPRAMGRTRALHQLSKALLEQYRRSAAADLDEVLSVARAAVAGVPADQAMGADCRSTLGRVLATRFDRDHDIADLDEAIDSWASASATVTASTRTRLEAMSRWGDATGVRHDLAAALPMYADVIGLLPVLAWRGIAAADRRYLLQTTTVTAASDAAAAALAAGCPSRSLTLLEQGRGVLWSQLLELRTDLDRLQRAHPDLAGALAACRAGLDGPDDPAPPVRWGRNRVR